METKEFGYEITQLLSPQRQPCSQLWPSSISDLWDGMEWLNPYSNTQPVTCSIPPKWLRIWYLKNRSDNSDRNTYPKHTNILIQERKECHRFDHQIYPPGQRTSCVSLLRTNMATFSPDGERNINNFIVCPDSFRTNSSLTTLCWAERDHCREKDTRFCVGGIEYRTWDLFPGGRDQRDWWSIEWGG